jgi:asparagine synthase (glutamine-hydrolysing)
MSIIFGMIEGEGSAVKESQLLDLAQATIRYAPDGTFVRAKGRVGMGFQPYHTHKRSHLESQPFVDHFGNMVVLDGRLDNHQELCQLLDSPGREVPDSILVLRAFARWDEDCFSRFTGDWSLALWSVRNRSLYLARDHAGTRSLYFERSGSSVRWSTYLETFFGKDESRRLEESFASRYISGMSCGDLTPYCGVLAVTPAHFIRFQEGSVVRRPHWEWLQRKSISYASDAEYEAHFVSLFRQAVERRIGEGAPTLAELSGGMDSTSIVCMSDQIRNGIEEGPITLLDTISYYDQSEPDWDERKYFELTEYQRGKRGMHLHRTLADRSFQLPIQDPDFYFLPSNDIYTSEKELELESVLSSKGYRAILSGLGGDEVLGGVPTPDPELADYLISGQFGKLFKGAFEWCLIDRTPVYHRVIATARHLARLYSSPGIDLNARPMWLRAAVHSSDNQARKSEREFGKLRGSLPSSIENGIAWWSVLSGLSDPAHQIRVRYEYRYPYLDKDLVNFLFQIPRSQIVRPGRRRSLMRRAMRNIVPHAVLERPRKGFIRRAPHTLFQAERSRLLALFEEPLLEHHGLINKGLLQTIVRENDDPASVFPILRAGWFELWLQSSQGRIFSSPTRSNIDAIAIGA